LLWHGVNVFGSKYTRSIGAVHSRPRVQLPLAKLICPKFSTESKGEMHLWRVHGLILGRHTSQSSTACMQRSPAALLYTALSFSTNPTCARSPVALAAVFCNESVLFANSYAILGECGRIGNAIATRIESHASALMARLPRSVGLRQSAEKSAIGGKADDGHASIWACSKSFPLWPGIASNILTSWASIIRAWDFPWVVSI
jgi:hypothetical protein